MKKIKILKLNQINKDEIVKREMNNLTGGHCGSGHSGCSCPCAYEGTPGGSSSFTNLSWNLYTGIIPSYSPDA